MSIDAKQGLGEVRRRGPTMCLSAQVGYSLLMLSAMVATFAVTIFIAENTPLLSNHVASEIARTQETGGLYYSDNGYIDEGDYVLLDKLYNDDYARGGVYFVGTSELQAGFMEWALTPNESRLIHNYSIGNMRHREIGQWLQMLVEENQLLEAGGENTTVVLSLTFQMTRINQNEMYVDNLFHRHGLYTYSERSGIHNVQMPAWRRWLALERDRVRRSLRLLMFNDYSRVVTYDDPLSERFAHMNGVMEGDWRGEMRRQVAFLAEQIDYLQARGVVVRALYPPQGTWQDELPYADAYYEMVAPILAERGVRISDMRDLVPDQHFRDAIHVKYRGRVIFHEALMDLARESLREMGTDPSAPQTSTRRK